MGDVTTTGQNALVPYPALAAINRVTSAV